MLVHILSISPYCDVESLMGSSEIESKAMGTCCLVAVEKVSHGHTKVKLIFNLADLTD